MASKEGPVFPSPLLSFCDFCAVAALSLKALKAASKKRSKFGSYKKPSQFLLHHEMAEQIVLTEAFHILRTTGQYGQFIEYLKMVLTQRAEMQIVRFPIEVDFYDCMEHYCSLLEQLLENPTKVTKAFASLLKAVIKHGCPSSLHILPVVELRLQNFPSLCANPATSLPGIPYQSLLAVIVGITGVGQYTQCAQFSCKTPACSSQYQSVWHRVFTPGIPGICNQVCRCANCNQRLDEDLQYRVTGMFVSCKVVDPAVLQTTLASDRRYYNEQAFQLTIRDDLISRVQLGGTYNVTVLCEKKRGFSAVSSRSLEVNNLSSYIPSFTASGLPKVLLELYGRSEQSPWSLPATVAYLLAWDVAPPLYALETKLVLLLSLASFNNSASPLSVAVFDTDNTVTNRVIRSIARFANRFVRHGSADTLAVAESKDTLLGKTVTEAGSLLLAAGGICYLPHLSLWKPALLTDLRRILSHEAVPLGNLSVPLQCAVWTLHERNTTNKIAMSSFKDSVLLSTVSEFGLILSSDENVGDDSTVCEELLKRVDGSSPGYVLSDEELRQYLFAANNVNPTLTTEAENILQRYFVASRRIRENLAAIKRSTLKTLTTITLAHARLKLASEAQKADAVAAIWLVEKCLSKWTGSFVITGVAEIFNKGRVSQSLSDLIGREHDAEMMEFQHALESFLQNVAEE